MGECRCTPVLVCGHACVAVLRMCVGGFVIFVARQGGGDKVFQSETLKLCFSVKLQKTGRSLEVK